MKFEIDKIEAVAAVSPSARREWVEIAKRGTRCTTAKVSLREEGVG